MDVGLAGPQDIDQLARLLQLFASPAEQQQFTGAFASDLADWWAEHARSHIPFVARLSGSDVVGMAWLALVHRVPRPGRMALHSSERAVPLYERLGFTSSPSLLQTRPPALVDEGLAAPGN